MSTSKTQSDQYAQRIGQVLDYIQAHLDEELSVDTLSRVANFSRYHFHRQFSAYTGITVTRLVQLLRLRRASIQLVFNPLVSITDVAYQAGFANAESFSRAFRRELGQTPTAFRRNPRWQPWHMNALPDIAREPKTCPVEIVQFPETRVAALEHHGPREGTYTTMLSFAAWKGEYCGHGKGDIYGVYHNNPATTPPQDYRFDFCLAVAMPVPANPQGVINKVMASGRCARIRHKGMLHHSRSLDWFCHEWPQQNGERRSERPLFCHFVNVGFKVRESDQLTDIYLPLQ